MKHGAHTKTKTILTATLCAGVLALVFVFASPPALSQPQDTAPPPVFDIGGIQIAPHRALYDLELASVTTGSPVSGVTGQMYFQWEDACEAWSTDHRFTIEYGYTDRPALSTTSHFISWETKDGAELHFTSENEENGLKDEDLKGSVSRFADGSGVAKHTKPAGLGFDLPKGFLLPSQHTIELLKRAKAGDQIFYSVLFDGSDEEGPVAINSFITKEVSPEKLPKDLPAQVDRTLLQTRAWNVRMAFFSLQEPEAEPVYEMTMTVHENGVVSAIRVDYKNFSVQQKLLALDALPKPECL